MLRKVLVLVIFFAIVALSALAQDSELTAAEIEEIGRTGAVSVGGGYGLQQEVIPQEAMTPNEELVMKWIDASIRPETVGTAAQDMLTPDFVFYGLKDTPAQDVAAFIKLDTGQYYLPNHVASCVVKSEDDLVEASYNVVNFYGMGNIPRTILFRITDGKIAEAWLDHTL